MRNEGCFAANARGFACVLALVAALPAAAFVQGGSYPERPVRLLVGFVPGGAADLVARALGQKLAERWGQQVIVDNRPGAGGVIATQIAGKAPRDGYTLFLGSSSQFVFGPAMQPDTPYDPIADYTPIAKTALVPIVLAVHPSLPSRSITELIQLAKTRPGQLSYASPGAGSGPHLAGVLFGRAAGIEIVHVPYRGGSEALVALLGGHVQVSSGAISTALPHMKSGKLRALAVTELRRLSSAPDVPTVAESGLPGFEVSQWYGVFGPARLPTAIVRRVGDELGGMLALTELRERLAAQAVEVDYATAEALATYIKAELPKWTRLLKEAGVAGKQPP